MLKETESNQVDGGNEDTSSYIEQRNCESNSDHVKRTRSGRISRNPKYLNDYSR